MSLIDEALKRAQSAHQEDKGREEPARPWTPAPLPDRRRIARGRIRSIGLSLAIAAALAAAAVFLLRSAQRKAAPVSAASAAVRASSSAAGLPPITTEVTVVAPPRGILSSAPNRISRTADAAASSVRPEGPSFSPQTNPSALPQVAAPKVTVASAEPREPKAWGPAGPRSYANEMPLPGGGKISLEGIVYSETNPVAVLNGRVVPPGGYVEGFTVAKILPDRVELEAEGTRVFLTLR